MTKTKTKKESKKDEVTSTIAKSEDGTIQITFKIPYLLIESTKSKVLDKLKDEVTIQGFRKGMAPKEKVEEEVSKEELIQKTLNEILPKALGDVINKEKLTPAIYPKFDLISSEENKDWQVRAVTCELPKVDLGNYKTTVKGELASKKIWTPGKDEKENEGKSAQSQSELENAAIKALLSNVNVEIPKLLIDEEVNSRLSKLLERIEKLGMNLENYLSSIGKTPQQLRSEYEKQAKESITLELSLNKIAIEEDINVSEEEINEAIKASTADPELAKKLNTPEQKKYIASVLRRKKALQSLIS